MTRASYVSDGVLNGEELPSHPMDKEGLAWGLAGIFVVIVEELEAVRDGVLE